MSNSNNSTALIECPDCDRHMLAMDETKLQEIKDDIGDDFYQTCGLCDIDLMIGNGHKDLKFLEDIGLVKNQDTKDYAINKIRISEESSNIYRAWRNSKISKEDMEILLGLVANKIEINELLDFAWINFEKENRYLFLTLLDCAYKGIARSYPIYSVLRNMPKMSKGNVLYVKEYSEKWYENNIVRLWSEIDIFNDYKFVAKQHLVSTGVIDIYAKLKGTNQDVIIELKLGNECGHRQLFSYGCLYDSPILINISEEFPKNKVPNVRYITFKELHSYFNVKQDIENFVDGLMMPAIKHQDKQ